MNGRTPPSGPHAVVLAFWECGHIEVDDGTTHECDGRDVCSATYHKFVSLDAVLKALRDRWFDTSKGILCSDFRKSVDVVEESFPDELFAEAMRRG